MDALHIRVYNRWCQTCHILVGLKVRDRVYNFLRGQYFYIRVADKYHCIIIRNMSQTSVDARTIASVLLPDHFYGEISRQGVQISR